MNTKDKKIYSEVYSVLNLLGEQYKNKLPEELIDFINNNQLEYYAPIYTMEMELEKQRIERESLTMITFFYYQYWAENEIEKEEIVQILKKNEEKQQENKVNISVSEQISNLQNNKRENALAIEQNENKKENLEMIEVKTNVFQKIINKIKKWFKI